jgi:hypothetical protein
VRTVITLRLRHCPFWVKRVWHPVYGSVVVLVFINHEPE